MSQMGSPKGTKSPISKPKYLIKIKISESDCLTLPTLIWSFEF